MNICRAIDNLYERLKRNQTRESIRTEYELLDYLNSFEGLKSIETAAILNGYIAVNYAKYKLSMAQSHPTTQPNLQDTAQNITQSQSFSQPQTSDSDIVQQSPQEETRREIFERLMREDCVRVRAEIGNGATLNQVLALNTPSVQTAALTERKDPSEEDPSLYAQYLGIKVECKEHELEIMRAEKTEQARNNKEILSKWVKSAEDNRKIVDEQNKELYELRGTSYELNQKLERSEKKVKELREKNVELRRLHSLSTLDVENANANYAQIQETLHSTRMEAQTKIEQLKSGLDNADGQIKELKKTVEILEKNHSTARLENDKLTIQNEELKEAHKTAEDVIQGMMRTEEELKREAQEATKEIDGLKTDIQTKNNYAKQLNASFNRLQRDRNELYAEFETTKTQRLESRDNNAILKGRLKKAEKSIDSLKQNVDMLEKQYLGSQKQCGELNASNEALKLIQKGLEETLSSAATRIQCMVKEIEAEKEKYQMICSEKEDMEATIKNVLISQEISEESLNKAQNEIENLKTLKYWSEDYIEYLKQDMTKIEEHEKELLEKKEVMEASIEELKRNQEVLELAQTEAQSQIEQLTSKLQLADERILFLVDQLRSEKSRFEKACNENSELKTSNEKLIELVKLNGQEMRQLQSDFGHTRVALRTTQSRCESDIQKVTIKLRNAEKEAEDMKKKVDVEVKEKEKLMEEIQKSELMDRAQQTQFWRTVSEFNGKLNKCTKQLTLRKKKLEKTEAALETAQLLNEQLSDDLKKSKADKKESDEKWANAQQKLLEDLRNRNLRIAKVCHEAIQYHTKMNSLKEDFKKSEDIAKEEMEKLMKKYDEQGELLAELQREKEQKNKERMELENEGYDVSPF